MAKKTKVDKKKGTVITVTTEKKFRIKDIKTLVQAEEWLNENDQRWCRAATEKGKKKYDKEKDECLLHLLGILGYTPEVVGFVFAHSNHGSAAETATHTKWRELNDGKDGRYDDDDDEILEEGWR